MQFKGRLVLENGVSGQHSLVLCQHLLPPQMFNSTQIKICKLNCRLKINVISQCVYLHFRDPANAANPIKFLD